MEIFEIKKLGTPSLGTILSVCSTNPSTPLRNLTKRLLLSRSGSVTLKSWSIYSFVETVDTGSRSCVSTIQVNEGLGFSYKNLWRIKEVEHFHQFTEQVPENRYLTSVPKSRFTRQGFLRKQRKKIYHCSTPVESSTDPSRNTRHSLIL